MMTQAFYTGISGLRSSSTGIDVLSNNLANVSTTGYRGYNTEFASLFEDVMNTGTGNSNSVGVGVRVQATSMVTAQGSLSLSDRSTDLAIQGDGWFSITGGGDPLYTRDGSFNFDENSDLVTNDGFYVLGTMGNNIGPGDILTKTLSEINLGDVGAQEKLRFPKTLTYPPEATTEAKFLANLGTGYDPITVGASVIDSTNQRNHLRLEFIKNPVQNPPGSQYTVKATTQSLDGLTVYDTVGGNVEFDSAGALTLNTLGTINNNGTQVAMDLGNGYDGIVSIDVPVVPGSSVANGTIGGDLAGYSINRNAEVIATFTNGLQSSVGKVAIFHFQNEQGLSRANGTHFHQSFNSGKAFFRTDGNGKAVNGTNVVNFRLENANVELSAGLTDLIIYQRSFDANSKSITTADHMIQKALDMDA